MIPRFDFGHFFKFLASIGLALLVAAVAAPWLFATTNGALTIPETDLSALTPVAQEVLSQRQRAMRAVQGWLPWASGLMAAIGIALLLWGLVGWRRRQNVLDETEEVDLRTKNATFEKLTATEAEEKRREEVEEEVREEKRATPQKEHTPTDQASAPQPAPDYGARMRERRETEAFVGSLLEAAFVGDLAVTEGVKVKTRSGTDARLDFLVQPSREGTPWGQLAIELRFTSARILTSALPGWLVTLAVASSTLAQRKVYTGARGRPVAATTSGVLLLIVRDDEDQDRIFRRARQISREVNDVLITPIGVVVVPEREIRTLSPEALRTTIADAWNTDGNVASAIRPVSFERKRVPDSSTQEAIPLDLD